ncbi:hypothetical protein KRX54_03775 [Actinomycetaceae bacterium TAE3-ERU4]|nr:hypothetical protein [Actinomycetaceae bacterium TAE3-ERU4]
MQYRIRPGFAIIERDESTTQIGTDPNFSAILDVSELNESIFLRVLAASPNAATLARARKSLSILPEQETRLLQKLSDMNLLEGFTRSRPGKPNAEESLCIRLDGNRDSFLERSQKGVGVYGADRLGTLIAILLKNSGIGAVSLEPLDESEEISESDIFPYPNTFLGKKRETHCNEAISIFSSSNVLPKHKDLSIVICYGTFCPALSKILELDTYLPVVINEMGVSVGPIFSSFHSPCPHCLDLWKKEKDSHWPTISLQLQKRFVERDTFIPSAALLATAAGNCVTLALDYLDARQCLPLGTSVYIPAYTLENKQTIWNTHPCCPCQENESL